MIISNNELLEYIKEDISYFDLTTHLQKCTDKKASVEVFTREDIIVSCTEEAAKIAKLLSCKVISFEKSTKELKKGSCLIAFKGEYNNVHEAYKLIQVLLEYSCKIATTTNKMIKIVKEQNPKCEVLTTRKSFPFAKKFCIKSILNGGAMPHRLGLSETILFFKQHREIYSNNEQFYKQIKQFKEMAAEKKIVVESSDFEDIKNLMKHQVDVVQVDKVSVKLLEKIVEYRNKNHKNIKIIAAGGINIENAKEFAKTQVDALVTSSLYNCKMADLGVRLNIIGK